MLAGGQAADVQIVMLTDPVRPERDFINDSCWNLAKECCSSQAGRPRLLALTIRLLREWKAGSANNTSK